jgi:hypothetical protein
VDDAGQIIDMEGLACSPEQIMARDADEILMQAPNWRSQNSGYPMATSF